jgi:phosphohistidine phosphatase
MSVTIYVMRHGDAEETSATGADADRQLTSAGKKKVIEIARGLKRLDVRPDVVLSSSLPRAMETATLAAEVLDKALEVGSLASLGPGYDAASTLEGLESYRGVASVMLVGHQPHLGELASLLMSGSDSVSPLPFKKGGVACFEVDSLPPEGAGMLCWFMTPKQLRALSRR